MKRISWLLVKWKNLEISAWTSQFLPPWRACVKDDLGSVSGPLQDAVEIDLEGRHMCYWHLVGTQDSSPKQRIMWQKNVTGAKAKKPHYQAKMELTPNIWWPFSYCKFFSEFQKSDMYYSKNYIFFKYYRFFEFHSSITNFRNINI